MSLDLPRGCVPAQAILTVGPDLIQIRQRQNQRRVSKDGLEHGGDPMHDPALPEVVVGHEDAAGRERRLDVAKGLLGEQEALEPDAAVAAVKNERVHQAIDDQVILSIGPLQDPSPIVQVHVDSWIVVGPLRMVLRAQPVNDRVDLNGVDVRHVVSQGMRHVVAGPGPDNQDLFEWLIAGVTLEQMDQRVHHPTRIPGVHALVVDVTDEILRPSVW